MQKFSTLPTQWRTYYLQKNSSIQAENDEALLSQAENEYADAHANLKTFQNDQNVAVLAHVASKMLRILGKAGLICFAGLVN